MSFCPEKPVVCNQFILESLASLQQGSGPGGEELVKASADLQRVPNVRWMWHRPCGGALPTLVGTGLWVVNLGNRMKWTRYSMSYCYSLRITWNACSKHRCKKKKSNACVLPVYTKRILAYNQTINFQRVAQVWERWAKENLGRKCFASGLTSVCSDVQLVAIVLFGKL